MSTLSDPAKSVAVVTPNDTASLGPVRGIIVATAGDLSVVMQGGTDAQTFPVPAGVLPLRVKIVRSTGTTAAGITVLY
ncbi:hypothetical protein AB3Y40_06740 [Yoonia sp. R2331]|uniref:spike base protein, RCAP_Rcc01079 family n=1 Tax=Yoonia sp. R2331 TaxID=3237238 RepID=UPI0034E48778